MTDTIATVAPVTASRTTEIFILLCRYGDDYWASISSFRTQEQAEDAARRMITENRRWQIVRVPDLPVVMPDGEVTP